jgi:ElaB/YqjD/DUF883 family membrane-anchored ribosome-binding protein
MSRRSEMRDMTAASDHIMKNVRGFVGGAEELLRATAHFSGEGLAAARAKVEDQLEELRESLGDAGEFATEHARRAAVTTDRYVHKNPWQAIGVAMAVGVLLGFLSNRR